MPEIAQLSITQDGLHFFAQPTPGTPNSPSTWQPDLTFSVQHGFYSSPFQLTLTTTTPGATIRYTTDDSTPSATNGHDYSGLDHDLDDDECPRTVSIVAGGQSGVVSTESYIFLASVINQPANPPGFPTVWGEDTNGNPQAANYAMNPQITQNPLYPRRLQQDLLSLPTVSITTDIPNIFDATQSQTTNTGIYTNEDESRARERQRRAAADGSARVVRIFQPQRHEQPAGQYGLADGRGRGTLSAVPVCTISGCSFRRTYGPS